MNQRTGLSLGKGLLYAFLLLALGQTVSARDSIVKIENHKTKESVVEEYFHNLPNPPLDEIRYYPTNVGSCGDGMGDKGSTETKHPMIHDIFYLRKKQGDCKYQRNELTV